MGQHTSKSSGSARIKSGPPALDADLIRRANGAGTFVDYGDAGARQYKRMTDEIDGMDLTSAEKQENYAKAHALITAQLEAESKSFSPYSAGVGPARFDRQKMRTAEDRAVKARAEVSAFMDGLRREQTRKAREKERQALTDAMKKALDTGALEFTVNGTTWRRKSRRSRSFTSE